MNRVHPGHHSEWFTAFRHLVFTFHDETFECVCQTFAVTITEGSITGRLSLMANILRGESG